MQTWLSYQYGHALVPFHVTFAYITLRTLFGCCAVTGAAYAAFAPALQPAAAAALAPVYEAASGAAAVVGRYAGLVGSSVPKGDARLVAASLYVSKDEEFLSFFSYFIRAKLST